MKDDENNIKTNNEVKESNNEEKENEESNNVNDSFEKVLNLQKLIHKQAGLKRLCKKNN